MKVKIINKSENKLPEYKSLLAAGMDISANLPQFNQSMFPGLELYPHNIAMIPTGLFVEIPEGYEIQIRPRSGLAIKHGVTVVNSPGTIDADYRGEIKVGLINLGQEEYIIEHGERIAQMVLAKVEKIEFEGVKELSDSDRGQGGFGSTGT